MTNLIPTPNVSIVNGRPAVTSHDIAVHFGKRHDNVVRDIRRIMAEMPEDLRRLNFEETSKSVPGPRGGTRDEVYFLVYRDGFILLVMGYTGSKAMQIKIAYIMAFNTMAETLNSAQPAPASNRLTPSTTDDRTPIRALVHAWAQISGLHQSALWPQVKAHFQLSNIKDLPVEWIPDALAFIQGKMDVQQKALPPAKERTDIVPIRVNLAWMRDFAYAEAEADAAGSVAFNEGCMLAHKLEGIAGVVDKAFAPRPDECRPSSYFDTLIESHRRAMKRNAEIVRMASSAFADSCNALEALATVLRQSDKGTPLNAVKRVRVIMQDGAGRII